MVDLQLLISGLVKSYGRISRLRVEFHNTTKCGGSHSSSLWVADFYVEMGRAGQGSYKASAELPQTNSRSNNIIERLLSYRGIWPLRTDLYASYHLTHRPLGCSAEPPGW